MPSSETIARRSLDLGKIIKGQWLFHPQPPLAGSPAFLHTIGTCRSNFLHYLAALFFPLDPASLGMESLFHDGPKRQRKQVSKLSKQAKQAASLRRTVIEASHCSEPTALRQLNINVGGGLSGQNRPNVGRTRKNRALSVTCAIDL
jgi:hypothetical protein